MTDLKSPRQAESSAIEPAQIKTIRPVLFWSSLGTVFVVIAAYVYISWIASGNATPVNPGPDPIPGATRWAMTAFQIACPILALVAIGYVVRKSVRERQLCVEAAIVIGSAIAWWHDPLINWFQPALFYNAGLVNFGNWTQNIPGWLSPDGRLMAEPVLMIGMIYIWMPLAMGSLARWAMGRARDRWPALGPVRTFCAGWLTVYVIEFPLEIFAVRHGLLGYPASIPGVTLWAGQTVQIPLYGPILWSLVLSSSGALMFFRNRDGQIRVEAGVETLRSGWTTGQGIATSAGGHRLSACGGDRRVRPAGEPRRLLRRTDPDLPQLPAHAVLRTGYAPALPRWHPPGRPLGRATSGPRAGPRTLGGSGRRASGPASTTTG